MEEFWRHLGYLTIFDDNTLKKSTLNLFLFLCKGLETLPFELQRNFQLMRHLDQRSEDFKVCFYILSFRVVIFNPQRRGVLSILYGWMDVWMYVCGIDCRPHLRYHVKIAEGFGCFAQTPLIILRAYLFS